MADDLLFEPLYPDVLGAITNERIHMGDLQMAVGVFPASAYLNQPFEVVLLFQNMIDQPLAVRMALQLPTRDQDGNVMRLDVPRKSLDWTMKAGEVSVLRLPVVPLSPTPPGDGYPLRVAVRSRPERAGKTMRAPVGGAPPSVLALSPFKLQVLRDVDYVHHPNTASPESVTVRFNVANKRLPAPPVGLKPNYEVLWTAEQMPVERSHIASHLQEAHMLISSFASAHIYPMLVRAVDEAYAANGLPLHPGEARAVAKMITYVFDNNLQNDPAYQVEDQRWFQALAQALAHDPAIAGWPTGDIVSRYLFQAAVYDAILLAFALIRPRVRTNLGDRVERVTYANRVLGWLAGQGEPDLIYVYLPLVLGGLTVNSVVAERGDDPWELLESLREAYRGRVRLATGATGEIFDLVDKLLVHAEDDLRRARILPGGEG